MVKAVESAIKTIMSWLVWNHREHSLASVEEKLLNQPLFVYSAPELVSHLTPDKI